MLGGISSARDITEQKEYENALKKKNDELQTMNSIMINREIKMTEMKKEINEILKESGKKEKYEV